MKHTIVLRGGKQTIDCNIPVSHVIALFQMNVDFHFTTCKLGSLNISEYLVRYGIQMPMANVPIC